MTITIIYHRHPSAPTPPTHHQAPQSSSSSIWGDGDLLWSIRWGSGRVAMFFNGVEHVHHMWTQRGKAGRFWHIFFFASWRCFPCGAKGEQLRKTDIVRMWINRGRTGGLTYIHVLIVILYLYIYDYICIYVLKSVTCRWLCFFKRKLPVLVGYSPNLFINQQVLSSYESCLHGYVAAYSKVKFSSLLWK